MHHHIYVHKYSPSTRRALPSHLVAQLGAGARVAWDALSPQFAAGLAVDDVACLPCGAMLGERATAPPAAMQRITVSGIPHGLGVSGVAARVPWLLGSAHYAYGTVTNSWVFPEANHSSRSCDPADDTRMRAVLAVSVAVVDLAPAAM